ncbi:MAG: crossover junction endodeoxyribonuclease RuvC [Opitutales bacterium]
MAKSSVRELWKAKLEGKLSSRKTVWEMDGRRRSFDGIVLGVDPSLRGTGLAVVEFRRGRTPLLLYSKTLRLGRKASMADCLGEIHRSVSGAIETYAVDQVALEQTIYVQNIQTAQVLGAARGAAIAAAAINGKLIFEYPPLRVKQAVVGMGRASKEQMAKTVMGMLGHGAVLALDEGDAAGVALCHAFTFREE